MQRTATCILAFMFTAFAVAVSTAGTEASPKATANASAKPNSITISEVEGPMSWGGVTNVTKLRHLYFAGQPDDAALKAAHEAGVRIVIDLRAPQELDWDEASAVKALDMKYVNVPVDGRKFSTEAFDQIEAVLVENRGVPTLIHCSSSNRAGGWLATHLVTQHRSPVEDALAIGRRTGITKDFVETAVRDFLDARPLPKTDGETK